MPGHLFVVRGDLTQLACDAWLLPTGRGLQIRPQWLHTAPDALVSRGKNFHGEDRIPREEHVSRSYSGVIETPRGWNGRRTRTFPVPAADWPTQPGEPRPWLTQVVVDMSWQPQQIAEWCAGSAQAFVLAAAESLRDKRTANGRFRPLLALPLVGTGAGGGWDVAGAIVRELVRVLVETVQTVDADVVIVTHTEDQFAAVQKARRELVNSSADPWALLTEHAEKEAGKLAAYAKAGQLVLFLGAGVSVGAGLPTWGGLLEVLAQRAGLTDDEQRALKELQVLDQARIIRDRLGRLPDGKRDDGALSRAIVQETTKSKRYGLTHALLASLPVTESVTTNYDTLFEDASNDAGQPTAVLPYTSTRNARRWLLKMHGCVEHPDDIVLTREDFLRYANRRGALAGIVQALLITRHMLFVGFSLTDDNFLRIADEVRRVVRLPGPVTEGETPAPFGTALLLSHAELLPSLWTGDIDCVSISEAQLPSGASDAVKTAAMAQAANQLEILLDHVLAESSQHIGHLLDHRYDGLLSDAELELRSLLRPLQTAGLDVRKLPAWLPIQALLQSLGGADSGQS